MEGVGLALRSVTARVKDATAKRSSVSAEVRIKFKYELNYCVHLNPIILPKSVFYQLFLIFFINKS